MDIAASERQPGEVWLTTHTLDDYSFRGQFTSVRLKREQIQLVALDAAVGFAFDSGNHLTERRFFEERH